MKLTWRYKIICFIVSGSVKFRSAICWSFRIGKTYRNLLKNEQWNDSHVNVATYIIKHPQVSKPKFILETDGASPKAAISSAVGRLKKLSEKFKSQLSSIK